jgi:hypothetical protein
MKKTTTELEQSETETTVITHSISSVVVVLNRLRLDVREMRDDLTDLEESVTQIEKQASIDRAVNEAVDEVKAAAKTDWRWVMMTAVSALTIVWNVIEHFLPARQ